MGAFMFRHVFAAALASAVVLFAGCSGNDPSGVRPSTSGPGASAAANPTWVSAVSQHSTGAISRHQPVRVLFFADVIPEARINGDASANVEITPKVPFKAVFAGRREIVIRPDTAFAPATQYRVSVKAKGLEGVPQDNKPFEFTVDTLAVNFELNTGALDVEYDREELMKLHGSINTADSENGELVQKILTARLDGKPVPIVWLGGDRSYGFEIRDIRRSKKEQELTLTWDGTPLGLPANKGEKSTRVPALDEFTVTQADAVHVEDQKQIQVHFSAALATNQDLKGLVRLSQGEFTTQVRNNRLTIYANDAPPGKITLTLEEGLRSRAGATLTGTRTFELEFLNTKPQVRFVGKGVILPDAQTLSVPFEAVSARAVRVTALEVFEKNIPQFLQVNRLDGTQELGRVGRVLWQKTLPLTASVKGKWTRYDLDVTELMKKHPGGLFQLTLSLTPKDAAYECAGGTATEADVAADTTLQNQEDGDSYQPSNWDYADYDEYGGVNWNDREDPCKASYYHYGRNIRDARNLLASNIGLIAKRAAKGKMLVVATALDTAKPMAGVKVDVMSYQNQVLASGKTDSAGMLEIDPTAQPFAIIAEDGGRKGYLRVAGGAALPTSHFDVGGETVANGIKGHLYGDRGVWRPGDTIYLTFAVQDREKTLPANHPVTLELRNPRGQLVQTLTNATPTGQFYTFELSTAADAPTGDWNATALIGGAQFQKTLKVETVMPNRLKIELDLGDDAVIESTPLEGQINAQWLSGATAANLRANVEVRLSPAPTKFTRNADFIFDDPARSFSGEPITVFDENLDADGNGKISTRLDLPRDVPGMLNATFVSRVFERGGAFSINRETRTIAAFDRYVGLRLPKGDASRDMLLTDQEHTVELASLDVNGNPVSVPRVQVTLYKVEWRWWWDQSGESLAQYARGESTNVIAQQTVATKDGRGAYRFQIKYPEWGRYLVRACDLEGGHCTGRTFYVDWPSWAGEAREQSGPAANVLMISADKAEYMVGETAVVQLPDAVQGRALLTLETGSAIVEQRWIEAAPAKDAKDKASANRISIPITAGMAPNIYVAVTMVQPHAGKKNDRPIRLYGVIPLKITDPATKIAPVVTAPVEWAPKSKASVTVSESAGRAMNYTVAVVDEGLLGLTSFKTPNLHTEFYRREALGVTTWDLFDEVAGAYGGELDRLLALGGSDAAATKPDEEKSRFPPVVKFLGSFSLKAGEKKKHDFELPQYVGQVRVMVVAGDGSAYGSAEKSVFVRQALMILPTLPRVIGPAEQFRLPVSVFTAEAAIRNVKLEVQTDSRFTPVGESVTNVEFSRPEEKLGFLTLKSGTLLGKGKVKIVATSGKHRAESEVWLEVRTPNVPTTRFTRTAVAAGETWKSTLPAFGLEGTQVATLEVSALPPVNVDGRLQYLIHYPHGCIEQTTSAAFPQLYLPALIKLDQNRRLQVENNIRSGLARIRTMQHPSGGFSYWPGVWSTDRDLDWRNDWGTTYAGHFMLEAEKAGYALPGDMKSAWLRYQKQAATAWTPSTDSRRDLDSGSSRADASRYAQAYRLFTLALAGQPEIGAMNRLRENRLLRMGDRWLLAAAYKLAGKPDIAASTAGDGKLQAFVVADSNPYTFGSILRDRAVVLYATTLLGRETEANALVEDISAQLTSDEWYSTQSVAFALVAIAQNTGTKPFTGFGFEYAAGKASAKVKAEAPLATVKLPAPPAAGLPLSVGNSSDRKLFVTAAVRAVPRSGEEDVSTKGLSLTVTYTDADGQPLDIANVPQGMDLIAQVAVKNLGKRRVDNLALTQILPAGWEIRNDRLEGVDTSGERADENPNARGAFWWAPAEWRTQSRRTAEYTDIRDDRVNRYFSLNGGESIYFETRVNAAYIGRYYLPGASVEAMYDATTQARLKGLWVEVAPAAR
jgi:uncharacterized protein YfaS (alpha-2-macroglobulin family)